MSVLMTNVCQYTGPGSVSFIASGHAPFVTGQVIDFTGGWP